MVPPPPPAEAGQPGSESGPEPRRALESVLFETKRVVIGQDAMLEKLLVALLVGGHVLLEGVPGLAKTLTIRTLARVLGGSFSRVQFTPDLVPADLVGTRIWRPDTGEFQTELGPVFGNLLLADEINRAPAKVQSALLEVMQEQQVTLGGRSLPGAEAVPRARHAEPDRVRGHLPAAGGPARPLPLQAPRRLPVAGRRGRRRRAVARGRARRPRGHADHGARALPRDRRARVRRPARDRLHDPPGRRDPPSRASTGWPSSRR